MQRTSSSSSPDATGAELTSSQLGWTDGPPEFEPAPTEAEALAFGGMGGGMSEEGWVTS